MNHEEFIGGVAQRAAMSGDEAEDLTRATLQTLAERISGGEARDLAEQLPAGVGQWPWKDDETPQRFGPEEFVRRVSRRAGMEPDRAREGVRAVFLTVSEAAGGKEFRDVVSQLPKDFWPLARPVTA
jgi:uncharacterized protein (DUF2267 family)